MRRRSFFKWTTLTVISILIVLTLLRLAHFDTAAAAADETKPQSQGSLQVLDKEGKPSGECPLKHTTVKAAVSGFISRVTVTQDFENNFPEKIEAVYTFPLPQAAAVDDLTMQIGERLIKGKIMRRQEAVEAYNAAKHEGKIATLLNQEQSNIFTQHVTNIMPGQQIRIVISYVETLKYEDGSYEWSFPMVVGPRYTPATQTPQQFNHSPAHARDGIRSGHDISIELDLDAGMPILEVRSDTHETEIQELSERHTVVHLKDRATIPNKDFVLTYRVAGDSINDAVLTHRSDRGGFFTLILQPPQRVLPSDVTPKELVFVLDTSGSMSGFPLEKAKEAMDLALNNLYPHDTFNLITFSGDTEVLFPEPVPATRENLQKAKDFLKTRNGDGGTEMMKAINAALDPSDAQDHVRIACFMTDGQVGNDAEIIAEVQKHPNARVFAMGFGPNPNRHLLDQMTQYGRGAVDYVLENSNSEQAARRFHERVRNPLLTDITVDWGGLPVTDVYPRNIPDLFSATPLILSGRYTSAAEGTIRLKGKMAGQEFVREIPVKLPETDTEHDVLSTLWARRKVDDLMGRNVSLETDKAVRDQWQEDVTQLGLTFKLMTQFTAFVAIDEKIFTGADEPKQVDVPGGIVECVMVQGDGNVDSCILYGTSSTVETLKELPLQGRSFVNLLSLAPGTVATQRGNSLRSVELATNGHRPAANVFRVDGVSANFGIAAGGESPGSSASGNAPALTAGGGTNSLATIDAIQELNTQTVVTEPSHSGVAQVSVVTKSGTNEFHGSLFHFFANEVFDASDWFANARGLEQPPRRLNIFGASFGGPIKRDHTFFFTAYEGLRLQQPQVGVTDVPSLTSRADGPSNSFLNAFPLPNGAARPDGFAEFASSFANPVRHDVGSFRIDHMPGIATTLRGRYSFADSDASERGASGFSLNTTDRIHSRAQAITGSWLQNWSSTLVMELNANYSRSRVSSLYTLDDFGGAVIPDTLPPSSFVFDLNSRHAALMRGDEAASVQRQFNLGGFVNGIRGNHDWKLGGDYRRLSPIIGQRPAEQNELFTDIAHAIAGSPSRISFVNHATPQRPLFNALSLFGQDKWRPTARLTFVYGTRWELAPAPSREGGERLWKTTFGNFAPRASVAYELTKRGDFILRGAVGVVYEAGQERAGNVFANSIPFISGTSSLPFIAFDPQLKLPYAVDWTVSLQRDLGSRQYVSVAYVRSSGKRLLHTETLFDRNPDFDFLRLITNRGSSDYRSLQLGFDRSFTNNLSAHVLYSWARSRDNVSDDSERRVIMASVNPEFDRGPSDFDIRHQFGGYISYVLPAPVEHGLGNTLFRNWKIDSIFNVRSARPLSVFYMFPTSYGVAYLRPDVVAGASLYVIDPASPGGRRLNPAAFPIPLTLEQGNFARNSLRGFSFSQVDMGLRRKFSFSESVALQFQADAFNLFNHPNFEDPSGTDLVTGGSLAFGESISSNGARTMRFSVKFLF